MLCEVVSYDSSWIHHVSSVPRTLLGWLRLSGINGVATAVSQCEAGSEGTVEIMANSVVAEDNEAVAQDTVPEDKVATAIPMSSL